jgi:hypothetical protein
VTVVTMVAMVTIHEGQSTSMDRCTMHSMDKRRSEGDGPTRFITNATTGATAATTAAACTITADAASTPVSDPPPQLHFVSPQLTTGPGKVTTLGGIFANRWTPEFRDAIHNTMRGYLHSQRVLLPEQQLLACRATIHHGVDVTTDDMQGSSVVQRVRCTGDGPWYSGPPRNDWVWVPMVSGSAPLPASASLPYKALQGRLPYRSVRLFTVDLPAATGPHPHWLAFVELTRAVNSGTPEEASQLVRVNKPNACAGYAVIDASGITGAAHLIPQELNCAGVNQRTWLVNSHIDLATCNNIYWMDGDDIATASVV